MTFEVVEAVRKGTPALIGLWGPSGSGKTYSALKLARGLVGDKGKIVVIDTENGRALFYAKLAGGWQHIDFQPPFTPQRYIEAMQAAEAVGADVIIVDSMSHVWEGEGGVIDMAESAKSQSGRALQGLAKWKNPKMAYKRMLNALLRSRTHVIFCLRAKELNVQRGKGKDAEIVGMGLSPICEKNFIYEMTFAFLLGADHKPMQGSTEFIKVAPTTPSFKVPEDLLDAISPSAFLCEQTGEAMAEWIGGGEPVDEEADKLRQEARDYAMQGSVFMRDWWQNLTKPQRDKLKPILAELQAVATEADRAAAEASRDDTDDGGDPLDDPFTDQPAAAAAE